MLAKLSLNYIDIIILIVWSIAVLEGLMKGLIKQVFGILAVILASYAAYHFTDLAANYIVQWFGWNGEGLRIVAFIATFVSVLVIVLIAGHIIDKLMKIVFLGWLNRLAGIFFGWIKWNVLLAVVMHILHLVESYTPFLPDGALHASRLYPVILKFGSLLLPYLPFLQSGTLS
ncbi:MAG: CvpA family protein [Bacteroidales bacterium]|nr:CvpA family protein [Bacteroidales bacterium]